MLEGGKASSRVVGNLVDMRKNSELAGGKAKKHPNLYC